MPAGWPKPTPNKCHSHFLSSPGRVAFLWLQADTAFLSMRKFVASRKGEVADLTFRLPLDTCKHDRWIAKTRGCRPSSCCWSGAAARPVSNLTKGARQC